MFIHLDFILKVPISNKTITYGFKNNIFMTLSIV